MPVVIKAGLCIIVLARQAEVIGDNLCIHLAVSKGVIGSRPGHGPTGANELLLASPNPQPIYIVKELRNS
jgi:hypothetical protein